MTALAILTLISICNLGLAFDCYSYDTDYVGTNLNNGLEQRTDSQYECQIACQDLPGCEGFTWASDALPDEYYRRACWLKKDITSQWPNQGAISGPKECKPDPGGNCCSRLKFTSSGSIVGSSQDHVIGQYKKVELQGDGRWHYEQLDHFKSKVYYNPKWNSWYISDTFGSDSGFAIGAGDEKCPEDMGSTWQYYDYGGTGEFESDPTAGFVCDDGSNPNPDPDPDQCVSGQACDGCSMTAGWFDQVFCCNNDCDSGWIKVDPDTDPLCQCGHGKRN